MVTSDKRKTGIGGSDIAAIAGIHPYKTAADVYARMVADVQPSFDNARMALGRAMEGHIIAEYARRHDLPGEQFERNIEISHGIQKWRRGELDALYRKEGLGMEAKLVVSPRQYARWGDVGSDQVPDEYLLQCHWYASLANTKRFVMVAFLEGDLREYEIPRDAEMEMRLVDIAARFMRDHVEKKVPPPLTGCAPETLRALFPRNAAPLREATPEEAIIFAQYADARSEREALEAAEESHKAALQAAIGDAEGIKCPLGRIMWKNNKDGKATDWQAVALAAGATQELINKHTVTKPGARVFRFSPAKEK
jgi:putative phage-type endonuclease